MPRVKRPVAYRHPINRKLLDDAPRGARIADRVTGFMGSWNFIVIQTVIVAIWILGNVYLLSKPFDPYPFILLNLAFSTQAAYAAPLILLAQTRQADRDKALAEADALHREALAAASLERQELAAHQSQQILQLLEQNKRLLTGNTEILNQVKALEQRILELEKSILAAIQGRGGDA